MSETNTLGLILAFAGVCVVNAAAVAVVWIQGRTRSDRTDGKIDQVGIGLSDAADAAAIVARRVEPVSNGFANEMRVGLSTVINGQSKLQDEMRKIELKIDQHLSDHATSDLHRSRGWLRR